MFRSAVGQSSLEDDKGEIKYIWLSQRAMLELNVIYVRVFCTKDDAVPKKPTNGRGKNKKNVRLIGHRSV